MMLLQGADAGPVFADDAPLVAGASAEASARIDGVCRFTPAYTDSDRRGFPMVMGYASLMLDLLPKEYVRNHVGRGASEADLRWLEAWDREMKITVVREPQHGKLIVDEGLDWHQVYLPNKN